MKTQTVLCLFKHVFVPQMPDNCILYSGPLGGLLELCGDSSFYIPKEKLANSDYTTPRVPPTRVSQAADLGFLTCLICSEEIL